MNAKYDPLDAIKKAVDAFAATEPPHFIQQQRRVAACMKFCEGKSTDWLEQHDSIEKVMAARDEHPRGRNDCPQCGAGMLLIATQNKKICVDCCAEFPWKLEQGQKSLVRAQR